MAAFFTALFFIFVIAYAALVVLLYRMQRKLIYLPDKSIFSPAEYGLTGFTEQTVRTTDNETIQLWHHPAAEGFPSIVYFHGNASNLGNRAGIYNALSRRGFGVLAVSYRGYGKSSGSPTEAGLYNDARAAIGFLLRQHVPIGKLILFGESLGTGVAVQMATEFDAAGLILQAPYTSLAKRAAEIYYFIPVRWMIRDRYHSASKIGRLKMPVLIFHGEKDQVIPAAHSRALLKAVSSPKKAIFFPNTGHNDFDTAAISEHVLDFARTYNLIA